MTRFEIRIEELVLRVPGEYADGLAEQLEQELRRLALDAPPNALVHSVQAAVRPAPAGVAVSDVAGLARQAAAGVWAAVTGRAGTSVDGGAP
jgi:hypothetical protein